VGSGPPCLRQHPEVMIKQVPGLRASANNKVNQCYGYHTRFIEQLGVCVLLLQFSIVAMQHSEDTDQR
jgi:hypothetical protein